MRNERSLLQWLRSFLDIFVFRSPWNSHWPWPWPWTRPRPRTSALGSKPMTFMLSLWTRQGQGQGLTSLLTRESCVTLCTLKYSYTRQVGISACYDRSSVNAALLSAASRLARITLASQECWCRDNRNCKVKHRPGLWRYGCSGSYN